MTLNYAYNNQMTRGASAPCANAVSSCAQAASMQSANTVALILDAIIMASIIIFTLISLISLVLVVLLVVLLVELYTYAPRMRISA